ncbi:uncharacterized protein LOC119993559 [Tripterygium wilfordii]|uniref:uncharacterized protein LOC119993559 n=1 Tax=Tripterygium wilfordii TaxID=458696 RepID=UPI0018F8646F|nr:uncharacterized protein LOC119993559 [Tripterygium wilfordii]
MEALANNTNNFISKTDSALQTQASLIHNQGASIRNLEIQVGQLANALSSREKGGLPSQTEVNPKGKNHCYAITLRNGNLVKTTADLDAEKAKKLKDEELQKNAVEEGQSPTPIDRTSAPIDRTTVDQNEKVEKMQKSKDVQSRYAIEMDWPDSSLPAPPVKAYVPPIPFPQRLKNTKNDSQFSKFLEVFKKLQINIPFAEALEQMPSYAKFMKEILSKKRRLKDYESVQLTDECSAIVQQKLPIKKKDPGSFTIPYTIGSTEIERALCDLGASINLMPLSIAKLIGLHEISPTTMSLVMADRSVKYPRGIIEDVLVKVDKLVFPVDFVILDMEEMPILQLFWGDLSCVRGELLLMLRRELWC